MAKTSSSAASPPADSSSDQLEAIDLYGNWKLKKLTFHPPVSPFGLEEKKSRFKIKNKGSQHVLIKKSYVDWDGNATEIALTELTNPAPNQGDQALYNANFRLKATVAFNGESYQVAFGSNDNGQSLVVDATGPQGGPNPGGFGTAGRGG